MSRTRLVAGMVALVALLVLGGGASTGAFWRAGAGVDAGRISTGTLQLGVGGTTAQVQEYAFTELSATSMAPGSAAQAPLTVANAGSTDLTYRLQGWTVPEATLDENLVMAVTTVDSADRCGTSTATPQPGAVIDPGSARPLAPGRAEVWCVRVTLSPQTPQRAEPVSGQLAMNFEGVQRLGEG